MASTRTTRHTDLALRGVGTRTGTVQSLVGVDDLFRRCAAVEFVQHDIQKDSRLANPNSAMRGEAKWDFGWVE